MREMVKMKVGETQLKHKENSITHRNYVVIVVHFGFIHWSSANTHLIVTTLSYVIVFKVKFHQNLELQDI